MDIKEVIVGEAKSKALMWVKRIVGTVAGGAIITTVYILYSVVSESIKGASYLLEVVDGRIDSKLAPISKAQADDIRGVYREMDYRSALISTEMKPMRSDIKFIKTDVRDIKNILIRK